MKFILIDKYSPQFAVYRLPNPFPLVRDFYSSLFDAKMRKANDRSKDLKDGKDFRYF